MPRFRVSIGRIMAVVGVVALNLGIFRALFATRRVDLLAVGMFCAVLLQIAGWRAFRKRGRARAFWAGFAVGGVVVAASMVIAHQYPESLVTSAWNAYGTLSIGVMEGVEARVSSLYGNGLVLELVFLFTMIVIEALPFLVIGIVVGLLSRTIFGRPRGSAIVASESRELPADEPPPSVSRVAIDPAFG